MRNNITALVLALLIASVAVLAAPANIDKNGVPKEFIRVSDANLDYTPGIIVVKYSDTSQVSAVSERYSFIGQALHAFPITSKNVKAKQVGLDRIFIYNIPINVDARKLTEQISKEPGVEYAEVDGIMHVVSTPNDSLFGEQWALNNVGQGPVFGTPDSDIDYPEALDFVSGAGTIIAMIDSGVDYDHPDLVNNFWVNPGEDLNENGIADWYSSSLGGDLNGVDDDGNCNGYPIAPTNTCVDDLIGYDFVQTGGNCAAGEDCSDWDNNVSDVLGHGSITTGIAGATTNNGIGVASACPNCRLMILRNCYKTTVGPYYNSCSTFSASWAVYYAVEMGADVISMSFGGTGYSSWLNDSLQYAHNSGLVLVAGAGNNNNEVLFYPAALSNVMAVANTDQYDIKSYGSNYGSWVDLSAPGFNIMSTNHLGDYTVSGGTSMSAPEVAGVAGMLLNANPSLTPAQVETALKNGADNIDAENPSYIGKLGAGRLNAYNSLCLVKDCRPDAEAMNVVTESGFFGTPLEINFTVTANYPYAIDVPYRIYDGVGAYVYGMAHVPANGAVDVIDYVTYDQPGIFDGAYVEVDWNETINESDEFNNQASATFTVLDNRPDITVQSVVMQSTPVPRQGKEAMVTITLANDGDSALDVPYELDMGNGDPVITGTLNVPANSNAQTNVLVTYSLDGIYDITVTADYNNSIDESNETNNDFVLNDIVLENVVPVIITPVNGGTVYAVARSPIVLTARATDANADIVNFEWYLWSNDQWVPQGTAALQSFTFSVVGTYKAKVVTSDDLLSAESLVNIVVQNPPKLGKLPKDKFELVP
ncbi:MAG: S8 family serine peptidase [Candidatus Woesearchaeota archaeon]